MNIKKLYFPIFFLSFSLLFISCSEEGSSVDKVQEVSITNTPPTINLNSKTIYDNENLELYAEVKDDGDIKIYEWRDEENKLVGDSTVLSIASPHKIGEHTYTLTVVDNGGLSSTKVAKVEVRDNRYRITDNDLSVFVANKSYDDYRLKQINDTSFNELSVNEKYLVADKLLSSMFFAYPYAELKRRVESGTFIVPLTLVKTMHFQCKALASTNVLRVRISNEKWKPYNKPITNTYSLGNKISV